jgi:hypothetical protein
LSVVVVVLNAPFFCLHPLRKASHLRWEAIVDRMGGRGTLWRIRKTTWPRSGLGLISSGLRGP